MHAAPQRRLWRHHLEIGEGNEYLSDDDAWQIEVVGHPFYGAMLIEAKTVQALLDTTAELVQFSNLMGIHPVLHEARLASAASVEL